MSLLDKAAILAAEDRRYEVVDVPEWGGQVRVRSLSGAERDEFEGKTLIQAGGQQRVNARNLRARLVAITVVDSDGQLVFEPADVIKLGSKSASALQRVFDAAQRLSGLSESDVEELAEGFGSAQIDA
ncbi:hypothetical protein [Actinomadura rupiterrae]|uniref:hypothetical protein n=1 Tax=Actinomadura rupiterrae TaxID=559627 RepID=UPI0020A5EDB5|nr:hypothetical protein [Actinomadura rupiterrae]MCP2339161.1 hypothetical protein [Actinomadura rupiterrae]